MIPVKISNEALAEIKSIKTNKGIPEHYHLRIKAAGSGCSGVNFSLGFDEIREGDQTFELEGITVIIEKKQFMYLIGQEVGFLENESTRGFFFKQTENS